MHSEPMNNRVPLRLNLLGGCDKPGCKSKRVERLSSLSSRISFRKGVIVLFLAVSILFHVLFMKGAYNLSMGKKNNGKPQETETRTAFKINPPADLPSKKESVAVAEKPIRSKKESIPARKAPPKPKIQVLSSDELERLGKDRVAMVEGGVFPSLILTYQDPVSYIREMYGLGARTVVFDAPRQEYDEIDLFTGDITPMTVKDFQGFSEIKRVIKDSAWDHQKMRASSRLRSPPENLEILLLVPTSIEQRWIGHQVSVFKQLNIKLDEVATVEVMFRKGRFQVVQIHLKDSSTRDVQDPGTG